MKEKIQRIFRARSFQKALIVVGVLFLFVIVFEAGILVGFKKAKFSSLLGDNYYRAFERKEEKSMRKVFGDRLPTSHGSAGQVIKISNDSFIVEDREGIEKTIVFGPNTLIKKSKDSLATSSLSQGDFVVVIGTPNDNSEIKAELIRVMPAPKR